MIHQACDLPAPDFEDRFGAELRKDEPIPYRLVLIGRASLQMAAPRGEECFDKVIKGVSLPGLSGLCSASVCDRVDTLPTGADVVYGPFPGLLWRHRRIPSQDDAAPLGYAATAHPELDDECSLTLVPALSPEPLQVATP
jgi:hypothetical protein